MEACLGLNPSSASEDMALVGTETVGWEAFYSLLCGGLCPRVVLSLTSDQTT